MKVQKNDVDWSGILMGVLVVAAFIIAAILIIQVGVVL